MKTKKISARCSPIRTLALLLSTAVFATAFAGCAKSSVSSASTSSPSSGTKKTIYVGTGNAMPPYCSIDASGKSVGYEVDFLHALEQKLPQYKFEYKVMSFDSLVVSLQTGKLDLAVHQFVRNAKREKNFLIPQNIYCISPLRIAVRNDSSIVTLSDLRGKTILMDPTSFEYGYVKEFSDKDSAHPIHIQEANNTQDSDILEKVADGSLDADLTYPTEFKAVQEKLKLPLKLTSSIVLKEDTYPLIAKKDTQLLKEVDAQIDTLRKDGTLSVLAKKWFGEDVFNE